MADTYWLDEVVSALNSATGGQVVCWEEIEDDFDPLKRVVYLRLREPFSHNEMRNVRTIVRAIGDNYDYDVLSVRNSFPVRIAAMRKTPDRDRPPWL